MGVRILHEEEDLPKMGSRYATVGRRGSTRNSTDRTSIKKVLSTLHVAWVQGHQWKKRIGVEDMVLIQKISESAIVDNLKKRFMEDYIYVSEICNLLKCSANWRWAVSKSPGRQLLAVSLYTLELSTELSIHFDSDTANIALKGTFSSRERHLLSTTLTFERDLDSVSVNHYAKYLGQRSFYLKINLRTHRHTRPINCSTWATIVIVKCGVWGRRQCFRIMRLWTGISDILNCSFFYRIRNTLAVCCDCISAPLTCTLSWLRRMWTISLTSVIRRTSDRCWSQWILSNSCRSTPTRKSTSTKAAWVSLMPIVVVIKSPNVANIVGDWPVNFLVDFYRARR